MTQAEIDLLIGQVFNFWTVIGHSHHQVYRCRCKCGLEKEVRKNDLICNRSTKCKSCTRKMTKKYAEDLQIKIKLCRTCKMEKPFEDFSIFKEGQYGITSKCKECKRREDLLNKDKIKNRTLRKIYNISLDDYNYLLLQQNNSCKICKSEKSYHKDNTFHVDHNHLTGKVRGLLCTNCNFGLGKVKEDINLLTNFILYLKLPKTQYSVLSEYDLTKSPYRERRKRAYALKKKYKINLATWDYISNLQSNKCKICNKLGSDDIVLRVDHDHYSSFIRGLLCDNCNTSLGLFGDNVLIIENAILYLQEYMNDLESRKIKIIKWLENNGYKKAVEALKYAAQYHTGLRKNGQDELMHQITIFYYLRTLTCVKNKDEIFATAFLHDILEDYDVLKETLQKLFGSEITNAVWDLTKVYQGKKKNISEYYFAIGGNPIASIVKGGDRINNHQTIGQIFTCAKQKEYICETEEYILPMLKKARNNFPDQELAYENIKHALKGQIELLRLSIEAKIQLEELTKKEI